MRIALLLALVAPALFAQPRPVNTYSIVARDAKTGEIGVAVQSHWFAVGQIVPWAEAGVGAVATQSFVDPSYGELGLELLRAGKSAPDALRALLTADSACQVRQVAIIDSAGLVATFTGASAIEAAGGAVGDMQSTGHFDCGAGGGTLKIGRNFAIQANLMRSAEVWPAMHAAFETSTVELPDRMMAAMDAAEGAGGDIRGKQSAALIVVTPHSSGQRWKDRRFDLRVDDHARPLEELRRLVSLQRAYNHMNAGDLAIEKNDQDAALREYSAAAAIAAADDAIPVSRRAEMIYWRAVALVNIGRIEEALPLFRQAFGLEPAWRELTPRLSRAGLLPEDPAIVERILQRNP